MTQVKKLLTCLACSVIGFTALPAMAQHADLEISVVGGGLSVSSDDYATEFGTGYKIFESDVAVRGFRTDDPGFEVDDGVFAAGDTLFYRALDLTSAMPAAPLRFWDGTAWTTSTPNGELLRIEDQDFPTGITRFTTSGITDNRTGFISEADSAGGIHQHIDFFVERTSGIPANGLYLIPMQLYTDTLIGGVPKYGDSAPFYLAFNLGLSEEQAEAAIGVLAIPEPETYAMLIAGLMALALRARRSRDRGRRLR